MARRKSVLLLPKSSILFILGGFLLSFLVIVTNGFSQNQDIRSRAADYPYGSPTPAAQIMYYCNLNPRQCRSTSSLYTHVSSCQSNLAAYLPGQTTGACYTSLSGCNAACLPTSTRTPTRTPTKTPTPTRAPTPSLLTIIVPSKNGIGNCGDICLAQATYRYNSICISVGLDSRTSNKYYWTATSDGRSCTTKQIGGDSSGCGYGFNNLAISCNGVKRESTNCLCKLTAK